MCQVARVNERASVCASKADFSVKEVPIKLHQLTSCHTSRICRIIAMQIRIRNESECRTSARR